MVRYVGAEVGKEVLRRWPEVVVHDEGYLTPGELPRVSAWVAGSGRGTDEPAANELRAILGTGLPVLIDADGLTVLSQHPEWLRDRAAITVLTPHAGELARLLPGAERGGIEARRLEHAERAARTYGCTVLLKGSTTVIADPEAPAVVNPTGTPLLATAGSGDVLSGMISSFLAAGLGAQEAAMCGAYLHGLAARLAQDGAPISASELFDGIPAAIRVVHDSTSHASPATARRSLSSPR